MARKNPSTDKEQELNELIASYETAKAENRQLYLDGDQLADIADKYATDRRFDEAQEVISYGLELHPGHTDLLIEQVYLYLDTMQLQKAIAVVGSIAEDYDPEVKLLKAEILLNEGKLDEAETLLNSIEEEKSLETIIDVAYLYMDMGYPEKALPWLTLGLEEYKENEEFLAAMADCYRSGERNTKAISFYNKLIDKNPYNPSYWTGLAKCHFSQQEFDKAVEACDFALAADDKFGEAHIIRAHSLFHLENETEAIQEYQLALQSKSLPPDFAHMFIGLAYANQEKWELAYRSYEQAMKIIGDDNSPILSDIYSNEIFCLSKLGRYEEAHQLCEKAKKQLPESVEIYLQEGRLYLEEDKFEEAKQCWAVALQYAPEAETLVQIGNYSLDYGMVENARLCFEEAKKQDPDYPGINGRLASICMILRDHKGFQKYNQMSETPLNIEMIQEMLSQNTDKDILQNLETFMNELDDVNDGETEEENN